MENQLLEDVKKIVKYKISSEVEDDIIDIAIGEADSIIKDYCNIKDIPGELKFTLVNISVDIIETQYIKDTDENIKSIQQGDTTISFLDKSKTIESKDISKTYSKVLNRYRRLKK